MTSPRVKGKLIIELYDDILTLHVDILSIKPYIIKSKLLHEVILSKVHKITLIYKRDGSNILVDVDKLNFNNDEIEVVIKSEESHPLDGDNLFSVDYKDSCKLAIVDNDDITQYRSRVENINKVELNNLGSKIEKVLLNEDLENEKIYRYLLEMNNKLDELLSYMRPKVDIEESFEGRIISLSADNVLVFSDRILHSDKIIFFYATLVDSSRRMKFAALSSASVVRLNQDGTGIFKLKFIELEEEIKDNIMRFVFNIDRANLKRLSRV